MLRSIDKWGLGYLQSVLRRPMSVNGTRHLMFCVADHFEPYRGGVSDDIAMDRLKPWCDNYMKAVDAFRDADGCTPRHTFFYPQEEYNEKALDMLGELCRKGAGEVEIHLHHRNDTADGLMEKLVSFRDILHEKHGMLGKRSEEPTPRSADPSQEGIDAFSSPPRRGAEGGVGIPSNQQRSNSITAKQPGQPSFAFVHGNWALCNSRPDGDWCGVNEELGVLAEAGCYADFTFPSAPSPTQPRMVNAIYRAKDKPGMPRGCDQGRRVFVRPLAPSLDAQDKTDGGIVGSEGECTKGNEGKRRGDELMLISGPLGLNWKQRKFGVLPKLENAEIAGTNPATADRVNLWAKQGIHVQGRPEWTFVKTHTHGCVAENMNVFLQPGQETRLPHHECDNTRHGGGFLHALLQQRYNDGVRWQLHYVTAREMYNIIRAAEDGKTGNPGNYRNYEIESPSLTP